MVCLRGVPISQAFTLDAKRSEHSDSPTEEGSGDMFTNISVFESPPRQGCSSNEVKMLSFVISMAIETYVSNLQETK